MATKPHIIKLYLECKLSIDKLILDYIYHLIRWH